MGDPGYEEGRKLYNAIAKQQHELQKAQDALDTLRTERQQRFQKQGDQNPPQPPATFDPNNPFDPNVMAFQSGADKLKKGITAGLDAAIDDLMKKRDALKNLGKAFLDGALGRVSKAAEALPAAADLSAVRRYTSPAEAMFDTRLAALMYGGTQNDQLRELRKIRAAVEKPRKGGLPVV